jgi:hypothetical protein
MRRQLARAAERHSMGLRALAAFAGAGNDQVSFELRQPAK